MSDELIASVLHFLVKNKDTSSIESITKFLEDNEINCTDIQIISFYDEFETWLNSINEQPKINFIIMFEHFLTKVKKVKEFDSAKYYELFLDSSKRGIFDKIQQYAKSNFFKDISTPKSYKSEKLPEFPRKSEESISSPPDETIASLFNFLTPHYNDSKKRKTSSSSNLESELEEFFEHLVKEGKTYGTATTYVSRIRNLIRENELNSKNDIIKYYDTNQDKNSYPLKSFIKYIRENNKVLHL